MKGNHVQIPIPEGVQIVHEGTVLRATGPAGENELHISHPLLSCTSSEKEVNLQTRRDTKKEKRLMYSHRAHIINLIKGVQEKFTYQLKVCAGHFPITVSVEKGVLSVSNFLGEKVARKTSIPDSVDVQIEGSIISVSGVDKQFTGQVAASIEHLTRIQGRDLRIFQDGIWLMK